MNREAFRRERHNLCLELLGKGRTGDALPLGLGPRHPSFHALTDQGPLKLGERRHHRKNQLALGRGGVNVFLMGDKVHTQAAIPAYAPKVLCDHGSEQLSERFDHPFVSFDVSFMI